MCLGGGNKASKAAAAAEAQKQDQIQRTTARVNAIFDSPTRQAGYRDFTSALRNLMQGNILKQQKTAQRKSKFSLASSGLIGGSAEQSARRLMGEETSEALLQADRKVAGALSDLQGQDEASRLQLINLAQTGVDTGTAAAQASAAIQNSIGKAKANLAADSVWDAFAGSAKLWSAREEARERRRAALTPVGGYYADPWG